MLTKGTSKKTFNKNIAKEVKSGKPVKQAVAIAYSVKRKAAKNKMKRGMEKYEKTRKEVFGLE